METKFLITIAILFLIGFGVILFVSLFMKDKKNVKPLWSQYFTVQIAIALVVIPASMGMLPFFFVMTFIAIKSQYELIRTTIDTPDPLHRNIALFAGIIVMATGLIQNEAVMLILLPGTLSLFLFLDIFRVDNPERKSEMGNLILSLIYPVFFTVFILFIYNLQRGPGLMIFFYLVSEVNNSFAQLMGRALGEKKIFPRLSPNKTRAGLLWGMSVALITGIIANHARNPRSNLGKQITRCHL